MSGPASSVPTSLLDGYRAHAVHRGGEVALADVGAYTFAELWNAACAFAGRLERDGVGPGAVVGIGMEGSAAYFAALLGVLLTGAAAAPLPRRRLVHAQVRGSAAHEIGIEQFTFGRDYPHPESTWPHTREWLRAAFAGVPEDELRLILGENAVRFLDLDRAELADIAARIGPTYSEINGADVAPA